MEWWVWLIVFWAVFGCGAGCRRALRAGHARGRHRMRGAGSPEVGQIRGGSQTAERPPARPRQAVAAKGGADPPARETPFDKLRREFVEGRISLEEYERAIDAMDPRELH